MGDSPAEGNVGTEVEEALEQFAGCAEAVQEETAQFTGIRGQAVEQEPPYLRPVQYDGAVQLYSQIQLAFEYAVLAVGRGRGTDSVESDFADRRIGMTQQEIDQLCKEAEEV